MLLDLLTAWVAIVSLVAFILTGWDKRRARRHRRRVRERTLLAAAAVGGSPGLAVGMMVFRHKTAKPRFYLPFVLIVLVQAALAWVVFLEGLLGP